MTSHAGRASLVVALLVVVCLRDASGEALTAEEDPLTCYTADNRQGDCRPWRFCRIARQEYKQKKKPTICLYRPDDPIVCCPKKVNGQFVTSPRPIVFVDRPSPVRPAPPPPRPPTSAHASNAVSHPNRKPTGAPARPVIHPPRLTDGPVSGPVSHPVSQPVSRPVVHRPAGQQAGALHIQQVPSEEFIGHRDCGLISPEVRADFDDLVLLRRRRRALDRSHASAPTFDRSHASAPASPFAAFDGRQYDAAEYDADFAPYTEAPPPARPAALNGTDADDPYGIFSEEYRSRISKLLGEAQFITAGEDAVIGRWPWITLIGEERPTRYSWFCGGALLNERFVITAAHCLGQFPKNRLVVRVGEFDLQYDTDSAHQDHLVDRIYLHPLYQHHRKHHDIALLRLGTRVRLGALVRPVCLPPASIDLTGKIGSIAGWGHTEFGGEFASVLKEVQLPIVDTKKCEARYKTLGNNYQLDFAPGFGDTKMCAHDTSGTGKDACQGDSGGPMTYTDPVTGRVQLVGLVSTGVGCGHPSFPGVYTRVAMYIDWIKGRAFASE